MQHKDARFLCIGCMVIATYIVKQGNYRKNRILAFTLPFNLDRHGPAGGRECMEDNDCLLYDCSRVINFLLFLYSLNNCHLTMDCHE